MPGEVTSVDELLQSYQKATPDKENCLAHYELCRILRKMFKKIDVKKIRTTEGRKKVYVNLASAERFKQSSLKESISWETLLAYEPNSILSSNFRLSIDTSSTMRRSVCCHLRRASSFALTRFNKNCGGPLPSFTPANECNVTALRRGGRLLQAMPVVQVTETVFPCGLISSKMRPNK